MRISDWSSDVCSSDLGLDLRKGRNWRPLEDTTYDPIIAARRPKPWTSWQRSEDYYNEGLLIWLEVDGMLRELSRGRKSMDDFAKAFFGGRDGDWGVSPYNFDDVVAALNSRSEVHTSELQSLMLISSSVS